MTDQDGVEHMPLFSVCFLPDAGRIELKEPNDLDEVKERIDTIRNQR